MIKKPIPIFFNLDGKQSVQSVSAVIHIDDNHTEALDLSLLQGGEHIKTPSNSTVTARFVRVKDKILISDNVACAVQENGNIYIPIDNAAVKMLTGEIKIEVNIVDDNDILTMQFPLIIRVNNTILADSEISPESEGTIPELLEEAKQAAQDAQQAAEEATQALDSKQDKLTAGDNITIEDGVISAKGGTDDYNDLSNKPRINGVELSGSKSDRDLELQHKLTAGDGIRINNNHTIELDYYYNYFQMVHGQQWAFDYTVDQPRVNTFFYADAISFGSSLPENNDCFVYVFATGMVADMVEIAVVVESKNMYIRTATNGAIVKVWSEWQPIGGGSRIVSGVVNASGTITFTDSEGNSFTTSGESVIGPDGFSPSATVQQTASGATITVTDKNGITTANITNGQDGNDYVLTAQDKSDIADIVLSELPTTEGVLYGNQSN